MLESRFQFSCLFESLPPGEESNLSSRIVIVCIPEVTDTFLGMAWPLPSLCLPHNVEMVPSLAGEVLWEFIPWVAAWEELDYNSVKSCLHLTAPSDKS